MAITAALYRQASGNQKWMSGKLNQLFIKNFKGIVIQVDSTSKSVLVDGDGSTSNIPSDDPANPLGYNTVQVNTPGSASADCIFSPEFAVLIKMHMQEFWEYDMAGTALYTGTDAPSSNLNYEVSLAWYDRSTNSLWVKPRCRILAVTSAAAETGGTAQTPMTINYTDVGGVGSTPISSAFGDANAAVARKPDSSDSKGWTAVALTNSGSNADKPAGYNMFCTSAGLWYS